MKIDVQNGNVEVPELGLIITPIFKRRQFSRSPSGKKATINIHNGPWRSWNFGPIAVEETLVYFTIYFRDEQVQSLSLGLYRSEWENDEDRDELELLKARRLLGEVWKAPPGAYAWGAINASIDPRSGYASISIAYKAFLQSFR